MAAIGARVVPLAFRVWVATAAGLGLAAAAVTGFGFGFGFGGAAEPPAAHGTVAVEPSPVLFGAGGSGAGGSGAVGSGAARSHAGQSTGTGDDAADFGSAGARPSETDAPWVWPTGSRVVARPWEAPSSDYGPGHRGVDVPAGLGTTAVAVGAGTITFAGPVGGRTVVTIDHGGGLLSTLDSVDPLVATGDIVEQGDVVGRVAVGHCPASAPCLHLGARVDGRYVDPTAFLPPAAWPVLLPDDAWPG
ncbi:murein hydrolase activator EnvC [Curtobacterium sp. ISL-83]|uniref:murein hydrolase activator EnvC family protein n=1 Tax=Curtobacterium sp. ISL-83 TaxID=2819145 RepID=UPI001BE84093|nr:M23 family metallopeptidase [Curtobacterium sp. ISL-83]MBT2501591.1 M23 family metallopeptidase [Curtobacterium sp. ISL-83]